MDGIKFSQFFDKLEVLKRVKDGTKSVLSKAGAFVRTFARSSIRKRKRPAAAGEPPSSHVGRLKDLLFFAYDAAANSVVIGPLLFKRVTPTVPLLLELGGTVTRRVRVPRLQQGRPATPAQAAAYRRKLQQQSIVAAPTGFVMKSVTYKKHPYMEPALEHERPKFPGLFANSIT